MRGKVASFKFQASGLEGSRGVGGYPAVNVDESRSDRTALGSDLGSAAGSRSGRELRSHRGMLQVPSSLVSEVRLIVGEGRQMVLQTAALMLDFLDGPNPDPPE